MSRTNNYYGTNYAGLLGIIFIVLKLTGVVSWSWVWVLCPFWGPVVLFAIAFLATVLAAAVVFVVGSCRYFSEF